MTVTFKQKMALVMVLAVVGIAGLATSGWLAMNAILKAQHHRNTLGEAADSSMELQIELFTANDLANQLKPATLPALEEQIAALAGPYRDALAGAAEGVANPQIKQATPPLLEALDTHLATLQRWLALKQDFGLNAQSGLIGQLNRVAAELDAGMSNFSGLFRLYQQVRQAEKDFLLSGDPADAERTLTTLAELRQDLVEFSFEKYILLVDRYRDQFSQVRSHYGELLALEAERTAQINALIDEAAALERLIEDKLMPMAQAHAERAAGRARPMIVGTGLVVLALIAALLWATGRSANRGLARTMAALERVAAGDLRVQVEVASRDEFGALAQAVNRMTRDLEGVVRHVTASSGELSTLSKDLSGSVEGIARENQQVADRAASLAAATEQMSATVGEVAQTTHQVNESTDEATRSATEGGRVISRAIRALDDVARVVAGSAEQMAQLGEQSQRIDMVIEVIRGVAEQTNLLALNAAIEAARAGDAGRGFAVVADEVRSLAAKTVQASDEITEIVHTLQANTRGAIEAIESGRERAEQGNAYGQDAAEAVATIERQVAAASSGTDQIAVAIEQLSSTVKEMAANMEEISRSVNGSTEESHAIAGTSQQVAAKASDLKGLTERFKVS